MASGYYRMQKLTRVATATATATADLSERPTNDAKPGITAANVAATATAAAASETEHNHHHVVHVDDLDEGNKVTISAHSSTRDGPDFDDISDEEMAAAAAAAGEPMDLAQVNLDEIEFLHSQVVSVLNYSSHQQANAFSNKTLTSKEHALKKR